MPAPLSNIEDSYVGLIGQMAQWPKVGTPKALKEIVDQAVTKQDLFIKLKDVEHDMNDIVQYPHNGNDEPYLQWVQRMIYVLESDGMEMDGGRRKTRRRRRGRRSTRKHNKKSRGRGQRF